MKKFLIKCTTTWAGEEITYSAIAESKEELYDIADQLAYDNFVDHDGYATVLVELFPEEDKYTNEMYAQADAAESEYYFSYVEKLNEEDEDAVEDWKSYELIYDSRNIEPDEYELGNL